MDELYNVGERLSAEGGMPGMPGGMPGGMPADLAGFADMLGGGADIEKYLQNYEQMLSEGMAGGQGSLLNVVDSEGGMLVQPDPGFVIKTHDAANGNKVFINMVSNKNIEAPHMKSFEELEGEQGVRVPMSVGTAVEDFDKKGEPCIAYDLIINPDVVSECAKVPQYRDMVCQLGMSAISQKYKVELDPKFKLPKLKYKGSQVQYQRIKIKKGSLINEVSGESSGVKASDTEKAGDSITTPEFALYYAKDPAEPFDPFAAKWGEQPGDAEAAAAFEQLCGEDLPCYRVNDFEVKFRGTMRNKTERKAEPTAADSLEEAKLEATRLTREMLKDRTCVVQIKLPNLDPHTPALKQFGLEISDECLRIVFPMLPRKTTSIYSPLCIWWPQPFWSQQGSAEWDAKAELLTVRLPTEVPEAPSGTFDQDLLDEMF